MSKLKNELEIICPSPSFSTQNSNHTKRKYDHTVVITTSAVANKKKKKPEILPFLSLFFLNLSPVHQTSNLCNTSSHSLQTTWYLPFIKMPRAVSTYPWKPNKILAIQFPYPLLTVYSVSKKPHNTNCKWIFEYCCDAPVPCPVVFTRLGPLIFTLFF